MKKSLFAAFALLFSVSVFGQFLVSSEQKGSMTQAEIAQLLGVPFIQYGAEWHKIRYKSVDGAFAGDTLSGLLVMPTAAGKIFPRLVYQHGTAGCKTCVPSRFGSAGGSEGQAGLLFAGMGYVSLLPDYAGLGDGRGFHPYVQAESEALAGFDMVLAGDEWLTKNGHAVGQQLFLTGYSQGGHASMALHRKLETDFPTQFSVTAAAHLSAPYLISGPMRDQIMSAEEYFFPAYAPNTLLSYQMTEGNLYSSLADVFRPEYVGEIQKLRDGTTTLDGLNQFLIQTLKSQNGGKCVPRDLFQPVFLAAVEANAAHPVNAAMRKNDVAAWPPSAPTRLFYCMADDQVPFENSVQAIDSINAFGATTQIAAIDVNPTADHGGCVEPAFIQTILFFAGFQAVSTDEADAAGLEIKVSPNPATDFLTVENLPVGGSVALFDAGGRRVFFEKKLTEKSLTILTDGLGRGFFWLEATAADGSRAAKKAVVLGRF